MQARWAVGVGTLDGGGMSPVKLRLRSSPPANAQAFSSGSPGSRGPTQRPTWSSGGPAHQPEPWTPPLPYSCCDSQRSGLSHP